MLDLTLIAENDQTTLVQVDENTTIAELKALVQVQLNIPVGEQQLVFVGKDLSKNSSTIQQEGVKNGDMIEIKRRRKRPISSVNPTPNQQQHQTNPNLLGGNGGGAATQQFNPMAIAQQIKQELQNNPAMLQQMVNQDPALADAVLSDDLNRLAALVTEREKIRRSRESEQFQRISQLNSDPFNPEYQRQIAEAIRQEAVNENMEQAIEYNPEAFGRVVMLYIESVVNSTPIKAFVDSGAQMTIMTQACAEKCGITRLIDTRWQGMAKGVGTARIVGRVHLAQIKLGKSFFPCSFTILEGGDVDFLLGLDMLRRHQCTIDLRENVLKIGDEKVPFLSEKDLPKSALFDDEEQQKAKTPSSTTTTSAAPKPLQTNNNNNNNNNVVPPVSIHPNPGMFAPTHPQQHLPTPQPVQQLPQQQPQQQIGGAPQFPQASIEALTNMGFTRDQAVNALRQANGNPDIAASILMGFQ